MGHDKVLVISPPQRAQQTDQATSQCSSFPPAPDEFLLQLSHAVFNRNSLRISLTALEDADVLPVVLTPGSLMLK